MDTLRTYIKLPSNKTIRMYKNRVQQEPGWKEEILDWCKMEAKSRKFQQHDFWGGFVLDEMKIQENLEMVVKKGKHKIVGFVDLQFSCYYISGTTEPSLATLASSAGYFIGMAFVSELGFLLQFIFLSDCGFRFPVAQFPSGHCTPTDLYMLFWKGVLKMRETGFSIYWCILDGADCNRQFIKIHFKGICDPAEKNFVTRNPFTGDPMVFMMDCKHNFKKIRNNIEKKYQEHLQSISTEDGGSYLDSAIKLLSYTSEVIDLFSDKYPIRVPSDSRLKKLHSFYKFMLAWRVECDEDNSKFMPLSLKLKQGTTTLLGRCSVCWDIVNNKL
ncbi:hypothetical protein QZH41_015729 [Actinostola sp. cb2023]|nr:hypothetical protein QZH41_015729 [Actinostola sp. cb2023]